MRHDDRHRGRRAAHRSPWRLPVLAALGLMPVAASAAIVSGSLGFSASGFTPSGAPFDTVTGTVHYRFDNSAGFFNAADGATVNGSVVSVSVTGLNLPGTWTPVLTYLNAIAGNPADVLAIGHGPTTVVLAGTSDWRAAFNDISKLPSFREFVYSGASLPLFTSLTGTASAVPEPGTWALAVAGLALMSGRARRRRPG